MAVRAACGFISIVAAADEVDTSNPGKAGAVFECW